MNELKIQAYLSRIGYTGSTDPTEETLRALQYRHLHTVPYENIDIIRGIPLSLSIDALYEKIVARGRGGYCFELNALYAALLRGLGFDVADYFARFLYEEGPGIPMRRHHVLDVTVPETGVRLLSDVGVGVFSPNYPVLLQYGLEQEQGAFAYRFDRDGFLGWVLKIRKDGAWAPFLSFTEEPQLPIDFVATSFFCERSPDSIFNKEAMVAIRTESGRRTLDGDTFKEFSGDDVRVWREETEQGRLEALKRLFGIVL